MIEYTFNPRDQWSSKLLVALMRRYGIDPYRYPGQRYKTVMARVPERFVEEILWPQFEELNKTLGIFLAEVTDRVISEGIASDSSDAEVRPPPSALPGTSASVTQ